LKLKLALCLSLPLNLWAATWERPAGAYTPTNHSVNITKYQTDSANHVAISSAKVDGDINKAFQGLNDLESRVAPSVTGNSEKFLTNNGTASSWGLITSASMSSVSATAGYVLQSNGIGGVGWGIISPTAVPANISLTNIGLTGTLTAAAVSTSALSTSGSISITVVGQDVMRIQSQTVTVSGTIGAANIVSSGMIVFAGEAVKTDTQTFTAGAGWTDISGTSVTVTPKSTRSRFRIMYTVNGASANEGHIRLVRGSTPIGVGDVSSTRTQATSTNFSLMGSYSLHASSGIYTDSPSTTSPVTYKIQFIALSSTAYVNRPITNNDTANMPVTISTISIDEIL